MLALFCPYCCCVANHSWQIWGFFFAQNAHQNDKLEALSSGNDVVFFWKNNGLFLIINYVLYAAWFSQDNPHPRPYLIIMYMMIIYKYD